MWPNSFRENGNDKQKLKSSVVLKIIVWDLENVKWRMHWRKCILIMFTHTQKKEKEKKGYHAQKIQMNSHA